MYFLLKNQSMSLLGSRFSDIHSKWLLRVVTGKQQKVQVLAFKHKAKAVY